MGRVMTQLSPGGLGLDRRVEILAVSLAWADFAGLRRIIGHSRWKLRRAWTLRWALAYLRRRPHGVVITDAALPSGIWKYLLAGLTGLPVPPNLIVSAHLADEQLWAEVLNLGGYDVLLTPFQPEEVFRVCSAAWREWRGRMEAAAASSRPAYRMPSDHAVPTGCLSHAT